MTGLGLGLGLGLGGGGKFSSTALSEPTSVLPSKSSCGNVSPSSVIVAANESTWIVFPKSSPLSNSDADTSPIIVLSVSSEPS